MAEVSGKRKAEAALWEQYRPLLHFLFIDHDRPLKEVKDIMADWCGFERTYVITLRCNEKPPLTSHYPGFPNMNSGSGNGSSVRISPGEIGEL